MLCEKYEKIRDNWIHFLTVKFNEIIKRRNAKDYEMKITEEIEKDVEKYFNNEGNLHTNLKVLGVTESFRGVAVKQWVAMPNETIYYFQCDKALIEKGLRLHSGCWNQRRVALYDPDAQKQFL